MQGPAMNKNNPRLRPAARQGTVLVYVMIVMTVFVLMAAMAVDIGHVRMAKIQLQFAADAAARAACAYLASGVTATQTEAAAIAAANYVDGRPVTLQTSQDIVFGTWDPTAHTFTVQTGSAQANSNAVQINLVRSGARGTAIPLTFGKLFGSSATDVHATATACLTGIGGAYSIIGMNTVTMSVNAFTDSYNSSKTSYSASTANKNGSISSNGNIDLSQNVKINGDARAGIGKTTTLRNSASVTGLNAPLGTTMKYSSATLPSSYIDLGDVNMSSGTVSIPGGTYLLHSLVLSGSSHIIWTGPTVLYIRDSYSVTGNTLIDTYQNIPANRVLNFLPSCTTATWSGSNICVGDLYAPDTDFTVSGSVDLMGRILAKSITNSSSGGMHYDEALGPPGTSTSRQTVRLVQ
jgi:Flp pilus assembly protein TadG